LVVQFGCVLTTTSIYTLEPDNILLDEHFRAFVCDFATSKIHTVTLADEKDKVGTPAYMAPEVIQYGKGSKAADVYAWGVIVVELITRQPAFPGVQRNEILELVGNKGITPSVPDEILDDLPPWLPPSLVTLVQRSCSTTASDRPTFAEICSQMKLM